MRRLLVVFVLFAFSAASWALTDPVSSEDNPTLPPAESPVVPTKTTVGTLVSIDTVKQWVQLRNDAGQVESFSLDTNTPLYDEQRQQMAFRELEIGDRLVLQHNVEDRTVNEAQLLPSRRPQAPPASY